MHREIQIKQFPIVTTHWWPKTRNERFVWENEQYLYRFLPLVHNHVQVIWVRTHIRCVTCVRARSGSRCIHTGRRHQRLTEGVSEAWCWRNFSSANGGVSQSDRLMQIPNPVHATPEKYVIVCCNYDGASAPRFRHALRQALTPLNRYHVMNIVPIDIDICACYVLFTFTVLLKKCYSVQSSYHIPAKMTENVRRIANFVTGMSGLSVSSQWDFTMFYT